MLEIIGPSRDKYLEEVWQRPEEWFCSACGNTLDARAIMYVRLADGTKILVCYECLTSSRPEWRDNDDPLG